MQFINMDSYGISVKTYGDYTGVQFLPPVSPQKSFHILFLLDTSGSMEGERIETVKRTLQLFANEMQDTDCATILTFSSDVNVVVEKAKKEEVLTAATTLRAAGNTNMEAGLCKLLEYRADAVFLLTDGYITRGLASIVGLGRIVKAFYNATSTPLYTLGYGEDHNAKLLQAISMHTRTSYTYAESNESIPEVVGAILVALRDEVARGVSLTWSEGECHEQGATEKEYLVGSLIANKPQWVLFKNPRELKMCVGSDTLDIPTTGEESLDVLEQAFRVRSMTILQGHSIQALSELEDEIQASPVAQRPLALRICAELAEHRNFLLRPPPPMERQQHFLRHTSNMTNFANQRGMHEFNTPTQRMVSQALVDCFTQNPTTQNPNEFTDPV